MIKVLRICECVVYIVGEVASSDGQSDSDHEGRHDNAGAGRDSTK